jgi:predicted nicotinamide N-methyase
VYHDQQLRCGSGLIGVASLLAGCQTVTFQDFNEDVLKYFTFPTMTLNFKQSTDLISIIKDRCRWLYGDWEDVAKLLETHAQQFDVIFTSETIYNEDNYQKLVNLFKKTLNPFGRAFVAGKTHYFGCGGGMRSFEDYLEDEGSLCSKVHTVINATVQREILELTFKPKSDN